MSETTCRSCKYFYQHYGLSQGRLHWLNCGHCTHKARTKHKRPDKKACDHYAQGEPLENIFVTKEYLTKALLDRVLRAELLPEDINTSHLFSKQS